MSGEDPWPLGEYDIQRGSEGSVRIGNGRGNRKWEQEVGTGSGGNMLSDCEESYRDHVAGAEG